MSEVVWKYPLDADPGVEQVREMPEGAKVLTAQVQDGHVTIWAQVDPSRPKENRRFVIVGTGQGFAGGMGMTWIATVQRVPYVWHVYERTNVSSKAEFRDPAPGYSSADVS